MADDSTGEKTEKASGKKLADARKKGQVVRSHDLVVAASSLAITMAMVATGGSMMARMASQMTLSLSHLGDRPRPYPDIGACGTHA